MIEIPGCFPIKISTPLKTVQAPLGYSRWQFSLRGMLLFTTAVAAVLAFAVNLPGLFRILLAVWALGSFLVAILSTANFATSDKRPRLAVVSWFAFGLFFTAFAAVPALILIRSAAAGFSLEPIAVVMVVIMAACSVSCYYRAGRTLSHLRRASSKSCMNGGENAKT